MDARADGGERETLESGSANKINRRARGWGRSLVSGRRDQPGRQPRWINGVWWIESVLQLDVHLDKRTAGFDLYAKSIM